MKCKLYCLLTYSGLFDRLTLARSEINLKEIFEFGHGISKLVAIQAEKSNPIKINKNIKIKRSVQFDVCIFQKRQKKNMYDKETKMIDRKIKK